LTGQYIINKLGEVILKEQKT